MFAPSRFPTRLLLRCPVCREHAAVPLSIHAHQQTFCPQDGVPMTVIAVAAGAFTEHGDWPDLVAKPALATTLPFATVLVRPIAELATA